MCDISDESSLNSVPQWLREIEDRCNISDAVVMVFANKCELDIDQSVVLKLETRLQRQGVPYKEISVQLNIEMESSLKELADMLQERLESFIQQRLQHIIAHNSHKSFRISGMGTRQKSRQLLKAPTP